MKTQAQRQDIEYPDRDGQRMADNTLQFEYITTIKGGLDLLFRDDPEVFVAGDLLWYPVEGRPDIRIAPDALVAFGRPKGYRGSYRQWVEGGVAPQVVFEVLSPGNRALEMRRKFRFYEHHGVEEYYVYDPDRGMLAGWLRQDGELAEIAGMERWVSPRLGVCFGLEAGQLRLRNPDGSLFATYLELGRARDQERLRADQERQRADQERQRADQERQRADQERQRAQQLADRLRALGFDPDP